MLARSNGAMAHEFYYRGVANGESRRLDRCAISYSGDDAFSYSTLVAKVIPAKGKTIDTADPDSAITLVSLDSMTNTTSRHLGDLGGASPFKVVYVPFEYGERYLYPDTLCSRILERLAALEKGLSRAENRCEFLQLLRYRDVIVASACEEWASPLKDRRFRKFENIAKSLDAFAEKMKADARRKAAKKAAETREALKAVGGFRGTEYLEAVRQIFQPWSVNASSKFARLNKSAREFIEKRIRKTGSHFAWVSGEDVVTSRHVRVPVREAKIALKAWVSGRDMRAFRIGQYSVVRYEGDTIQIGCHRIPRDNIVALYEALIGEFPGVRK